MLPLVIGVPVGFVSAAESKEAVLELEEIPYIVARGRKGGSAIAVAIIHSLLMLSVQESRLNKCGIELAAEKRGVDVERQLADDLGQGAVEQV